MFLFLHTATLPLISMHPAGQYCAHFPHPTHTASSTTASHPRCTLTAASGQVFSHTPQATHLFLSILATLFANALFPFQI